MGHGEVGWVGLRNLCHDGVGWVMNDMGWGTT